MGIIIALSAIAVVAVLVWLLYFGAKYEKQTCYVPTGEIKFVVAGESCVNVIPNLSGTGYYYDYSDHTIKEGKKGLVGRPYNILGVYLVSLLYPLKEIHVYHFEWDKLRKGDSSKGEKDYVIEHRSEFVNSLYFLYSYPIVVEEVELKGNLRINILANITFRVVYPLLPVFIFKGKWLPLVSASVKGAVADFARGKTLDEFRALDKEGENSSFSSEIKSVNEDSSDMPGIKKTFGVAVHRVDFTSYDLVAASKEAADAVTAFEVARLNADADTERARGMMVIGNTRASILDSRLKKASETNGGLAILQQEVFTEGLANFKGSTLSLGEKMPLAIIPK